MAARRTPSRWLAESISWAETARASESWWATGKVIAKRREEKMAMAAMKIETRQTAVRCERQVEVSQR